MYALCVEALMAYVELSSSQYICSYINIILLYIYMLYIQRVKLLKNVHNFGAEHFYGNVHYTVCEHITSPW